MDKTYKSRRNTLSLVKDSSLGAGGLRKKSVTISKKSMDAARLNSKALSWLYATVELGWRFLVKSKASAEDVMGDHSQNLFSSADKIPLNGEGLSKTLDIVESKIAPNLVKTQSPNFMGHMTSEIPFPVHLADIMISFFNQNLVKSETAGVASNIERQTISWFHRLVYGNDQEYYNKISQNNDRALGVVISGGTLGNITALTVARNLRLPESKALGVYEAMKLHGWNKAVILCSQRAHYSLKKAASLIGLGEHNLVKVPVLEGTNKIDTNALEEKLKNYKRDRVLVIAMVGVAGTTETGSIDDLNKMAQLAGKYKVWFHVDAAWAGGYLLSESLKRKLIGIEQADSVVIDGHKLLGLTMGHGMTLFKNEYSLESLKQSANYIIRSNSSDLGKYSLEGSKPFASFKLWFLFKTVGLKKLSQRIEQSHSKAEEFCDILNEYTSFEQTSELETNIITYRFAPQQVRNYILVNRESSEAIWLQNTLNRINIKLHEKGAKKAPGFVSRTVLESCRNSDIPHVVLRAIPINRYTKDSNIRNLFAWQKNVGYELLRKSLNDSPFNSIKDLI